VEDEGWSSVLWVFKMRLSGVGSATHVVPKSRVLHMKMAASALEVIGCLVIRCEHCSRGKVVTS
jgi:hypothetical protein